jgi:uncharacterized membrane protein YdfJ with MMPL/SSD domain
MIHRPRSPRTPLWRWLVGWIVILIGIAGIFLPLLPALVLIPAGVALVGRRSWAVRYARTHVKLLLRRAEKWPGAFGRVGRWLREKERRTAKFLRDRRLGPWERPRRT